MPPEPAPWPRRALARRYGGEPWTPVTIGHSGARVLRLADGRYLKVAAADAGTRPDGGRDTGFDPLAEAERARWLAGRGLPAPEVWDAGTDGRHSWLLTGALPGRSAAEPWPAERRNAVVDALADIARALHQLPPADCPFDRGPAWRARAADPSDVVVCHGDLCLPNVLLDPGSCRVTGLVDLGRLGLADRLSDLALLSRSLTSDLNPQYGPDHAARLLRRYPGPGPGPGLGPGPGPGGADRARLDHYLRLEDSGGG
ncbi:MULTISPECIES: aminoglycoside 3'-phosphotransferase [Streptomyces]|uniref:aminoglycoside 3'-phosphotransferase n=1 Tax=Streptomyces TaxID=1883 RepID=UPI001D0493F7|nr:MULTISPECIES: aminoglycoside 3'-phosphotransferase [Streptomyces]